MNSTEGNADILSAEGPCNRFSKTGLADSRRAIQAEDRRLHVTLELEHGQILYDSLLHLIKAVMILIKNLLGILQVEIVICDLSPWEIQHELDVVVLYAVVR